ncbi:MAG: Hsp20/alpha crystallin family protein [bacterium]|nr:Hsp20/alpha crystallin family protein [bacterium]
MSDFFEKLKKGMGTAEEPISEKAEEIDTEEDESSLSTPSDEEETKAEEIEEKTEEKKEETKIEEKIEKPTPKKIDKAKKIKQTPEFKVKKLATESRTEDELEKKTGTSLKIQEEAAGKKPKQKKEKKWFSFGEEEGQLTIDVYQTENDLVIQTAIAGVGPEDMDITIERDVVTLRGNREKQYQENSDYFIQECFWGPFSRQIILPVEIDPGRAKASFKEGVLTIRIPKIQREKKMKISISA